MIPGTKKRSEIVKCLKNRARFPLLHGYMIFLHKLFTDVMKKKDLIRLACVALSGFALTVTAQTGEKITSPRRLYTEGRELFLEQHYAAAVPALKAFKAQRPNADLLQETDYMLACASYELQETDRVEKLRAYLDNYPDSPHADRVYALLGSCRFYEAKYDEALALLNSSRLGLLADEERDERTYQLAVSYLKTGNLTEAAAWLETLRGSRGRFAKDAAFHLAYIRYTQQRYDEALKGFLPLQNDARYGALVPYYIAEIYAVRQDYDAARQTARKFIDTHPRSEQISEMYRILGDVHYHKAQYAQAVEAYRQYAAGGSKPLRRDALYRLGISYHQTGVYSQAAETLGEVMTGLDALSQNAALYRGVAYLRLADKTKARLSFEQAAASDADRSVKEQAAYNYALCLHETSFSAFGESVTAFEKFLNDFPSSPYAAQVSGYLVEVYMNTHSYDTALKSIERIAQPSPTILEAKQKILFRLGTQDFANADFDGARRYLNRSLELGKYDRATRAEAHYWRGETFYRQARMNEAAEDFTAYLQLTPRPDSDMYGLANYNLGYIAFHRKDYTQAANYFRKFVELKGNLHTAARADALNRIGDCHLQARRFEEAKNYYAQAAQTSADAGDYALYQQALIRGLQRDYSGKISLLNRLADTYPESPYTVNALYEKGRSYVLTENNPQAIVAFQDLVARHPESPVSRKAAAEIGLLHYQNGNYDAAISAYKQVVEKYPGSEEARLALRDLKSIYVDQNRIGEYAALANSMPGQIRFDANEQDSLTYTAAERIYMRGQTGEAKKSFTRYLQAFPEGAYSLNAHYYLCRIGEEQKDDALIRQHSGKLLQYPDHPYAADVLSLRAEVLLKQKQTDEALHCYRLLKGKAAGTEQRLLAEKGILRCAVLLKDDAAVINAATELLTESKLNPELQNEALYQRAQAYKNQRALQKAMADWRTLAKDTRNLYGAEAKYNVAQALYDIKDYASAEKELLDYMEQSTPHAYWLARSFVLLSDVYADTGKTADARQYLMSLQQNYRTDDDIQGMIESRLKKLNP